jgi:hypothetical protein
MTSVSYIGETFHNLKKSFILESLVHSSASSRKSSYFIALSEKRDPHMEQNITQARLIHTSAFAEE